MCSVLIVVLMLEVVNVILLEVVLFFFGFGVCVFILLWGLMIVEGCENILFDLWLIVMLGVVFCVLVLVVNLMGDGLCDLIGGWLK